MNARTRKAILELARSVQATAHETPTLHLGHAAGWDDVEFVLGLPGAKRIALAKIGQDSFGPTTETHAVATIGGLRIAAVTARRATAREAVCLVESKAAAVNVTGLQVC